jgi:4-hydroxythreonine-4-phosphate dehydrogenase
MTKSKLELVVSTGDPLGIGPEVSVKAAVALSKRNDAPKITLVMTEESLRSSEVSDLCQGLDHSKVDVLTVPNRCQTDGMGPTRESGDAALAILKLAFARVVEAPKVRALVTAPVSKIAIDRPDRRFLGHTGWLAQECGGQDVVMLFTAPKFRVALATVHVPLKRVCSELTTDALVRTLRVTDAGLRNLYRIRRPKIALLGLNPHAGEGGLLGEEEQTVIVPAIHQSSEDLNADILGPFSADTFFAGDRHEKFDVVIAMYHDQGLIPVKALAFGRSVNVTLGLPVIRTSVDHGCAFDLFGQGRADSESMIAALEHGEALLQMKS